jgi:hypothetical protein
MALSIAADTSVTFPVADDHPLSKAQSFRTLTLEDIAAHPTYSKVLEARLAEQLATHAADQRTAQLQTQLRTSIAAQMAALLGPIQVLALENITIGDGQTLTLANGWNEVTAGEVRIAPTGVLLVLPQYAYYSATLKLTCDLVGPT